jgi:acylphosphatase
MNAAFTATITGRVQIVRFRSFVFRNAKRLNLVGEVENMKDGSVRVVAEGEKKDLEALLVHLHQGPLLARVDSVTVQWLEPSHMFDGFSIKNPWTV